MSSTQRPQDTLAGDAPSRRDRVVDAVVVLFVVAYDQVVHGLPGIGPAAGLPLALGLCLPHLVHRRKPVAAYAVVLTTAFAQLALWQGPRVADLMIAVTLAALADRRPPRTSLPAAAAALAWTAALGALHLGRGGFGIGELAVAALLVVTAWFAGQLSRTRTQHLQALRDRAEQAERRREADLQVAAAQERTRIAREFHDVVSHSLSAVTLLADGAASTVDSDPEAARQAMVRVRDTGREAMAQLRSMLTVLRTEDAPDLASAPRLADLPALIEQARATGTPVRDRLETLPDLPADVQVVTYRVVQEALTNVRRHAGPVSRVHVRVESDGDDLRIRVTDDGRGSSESPPGHGLVGMRERVAALGGTLRTGPRPEGGFAVEATLPQRKEIP